VVSDGLVVLATGAFSGSAGAGAFLPFVDDSTLAVLAGVGAGLFSVAGGASAFTAAFVPLDAAGTAFGAGIAAFSSVVSSLSSR